jgi:hypothetical protein
LDSQRPSTSASFAFRRVVSPDRSPRRHGRRARVPRTLDVVNARASESFDRQRLTFSVGVFFMRFLQRTTTTNCAGGGKGEDAV